LLRSYQRISPGLRHVYAFRNKASFYVEQLLAPLTTPKPEDHPSSAVRDRLFNIFAAALHIGGHSSNRNLMARHVLVTATHFFFFDGATARGGPWPPLQYTSKPLDHLLCPSIRLFPSFSVRGHVIQPSHFWSSASSFCIQLSVHRFGIAVSCILSI